MTAFASRCFREIIRDPLNLILGGGLPLLILVMFSLFDIPAEVYSISNFAPAIIVFGFAFLTSAMSMLVARDRSGAFLPRLFSSPLRPWDYILGYCLPMLPVALLQYLLFIAAALIMGLGCSIGRILLTLMVLMPSATLFIAVGLLFGTVFRDKSLGGPFTLFINLSTWLSGTWFDLDAVGGWFKAIGNVLPFVHCVKSARAALTGDLSEILPQLLWVLLWTAAVFIAAAAVFQKKMRSGK